MPSDQAPSAASTPPLLVVCLCAAWCGSCREYQPLFAQLALEFKSVQFGWVDIEDHAELIEPIDIDNFPTILLWQGDAVLFFGTLTPHIASLRRLIQTQLTAPHPQPVDQNVITLAQRVSQHLAGSRL